MEVELALSAVPASPIPPALESGVIAMKGNEVVMVLSCRSLSVTPEPPVGCAQAFEATQKSPQITLNDREKILFIGGVKIGNFYFNKTSFSVCSAKAPSGV